MSHNDFDGLGEYLSEFTTLGGTPTSLSGYGFGAERHAAELAALGAGVATAGAAPTKFRSASYAHKPQPASTVQSYLNALQAKAGSSGRYDTALQNGWNTYVKVFKEPQGLLLPAEPERGLLDYTTVWLGVDAFKRLAERAQKAGPAKKTPPSKAGTPPPRATSTPAASVTPTQPAPISAGDLVTSTSSVQDILVRLGWRDKDKTTGPVSNKLTDGTYGAVTAQNWAASARKRKLDPYIAKKSADGTSVVVREKTFLNLKAVADTLVPPEKGGIAPTPAPAASVEITEKRLTAVLARLTSAPAGATATWPQLVSMYQDTAKRAGLDVSIAKNTKGAVVVTKSTWDAFVKAYDEKAPAPAPPSPAEKTAVEKAEANVKALAKTSLPTATLKKFFNIAIEQGVIKREKFASDSWSPDYAPLLVTMFKVDGPLKTAWEQQLVVGKLVARDKQSVKLPAQQVASIKKTVSDYATQKRASTQTPAGYTKVNTAHIIEAVNKISVSSKVFNPSGGAKELADALQTFLSNTQQSAGGDIVKVLANKDVVALSSVLGKLADATKLSEERAKATESYRKRMVEDALKASTASVTVDELQQALIESVESGKVSGSTKNLYQKVKLNGAFDSATQAAYTELARTLTIGPAVQQFQQLLQQQLGPNFKASLVTEVQNKVWSEFLGKAVSKSSGKLQLKMLPAVAKSVSEAAAAYRSRKAKGQVEQEKIAGLNKIRDAAVKSSNVIVAMLDLQMAILRMLEAKDIGAVKTWSGAVETVKLTGQGDQPTRDGLFIGFWPMIFPKGVAIPETLWKEYTARVGLRVASNKVSASWSGANYIALPQAAANHVSKMALEYINKHGDSPLRNDLAPVPLQNQELRLLFDNPSVVTVRAPTKPTVATGSGSSSGSDAAAKKLAADKKRLAAEKKKLADAKKKQAAEAKKLADAKRKLAEEKKALAAKNATDAAAQEAARRAEQEAQAAERAAMDKTADSIAARTSELIATREAQAAQSGSTSSGAGGGGGEAAGGQGGSGGATGPITFAPTINVTGGGGGSEPSISPPSAAPASETPSVETPVSPTEASIIGGNMWLWLLGGAGLYLLRDKSADGAPKTKYSAPVSRSTRRTSYARTRRPNRGARRPGRARP